MDSELNGITILDKNNLKKVYEQFQECILTTSQVLNAKDILFERGFSIVDIIACNLTSLVLKAICMTSGKEVAIKTQICRNKQMIAEFQRQFALFSQMEDNQGCQQYQQENKLLDVHQIYYDDASELLFVVMDLCINGDLYHFSRQNVHISRLQMIDICQQVIKAIIVLHSAEIIHGDINPSNFLVDANLSIKISYQSASKFLFNTVKQACFNPFSITFCSQEQFEQQQVGSIQSDLFSTGVVLLDLLGLRMEQNYDLLLSMKNRQYSQFNQLHKNLQQAIPQCLQDILLISLQLIQNISTIKTTAQSIEFLNSIYISLDSLKINENKGDGQSNQDSVDLNLEASNKDIQYQKTKIQSDQDRVNTDLDCIQSDKDRIENIIKSDKFRIEFIQSRIISNQDRFQIEETQIQSNQSNYIKIDQNKDRIEYNLNSEQKKAVDSSLFTKFTLFIKNTQKSLKEISFKQSKRVQQQIIRLINYITALINVYIFKSVVQQNKKQDQPQCFKSAIIQQDKYVQTLPLDLGIDTISAFKESNQAYHHNSLQQSNPNTFSDSNKNDNRILLSGIKCTYNIPQEYEVTTQYLDTDEEEVNLNGDTNLSKKKNNLNKIDLDNLSSDDSDLSFNDSDTTLINSKQISSPFNSNLPNSDIVLADFIKCTVRHRKSRNQAEKSPSEIKLEERKRDSQSCQSSKILSSSQFSTIVSQSYSYCSKKISPNQNNQIGSPSFSQFKCQNALSQNINEGERKQDIIFFGNGYYIGEVSNRQPNGNGIMYFHKGHRYEGQFVNGQYDGKGVYYYLAGNKYTGQWKDNQREGKGLFTWANGTIYLGQYKQNIKSGQGTLKFSNGERYDGQFENNFFHGNGTYHFKDGSKYEGQFANGNRTSKGSFYLPDGNITNNSDFKPIPNHKKNKSITYPYKKEENPMQEQYIDQEEIRDKQD